MLFVRVTFSFRLGKKIKKMATRTLYVEDNDNAIPKIPTCYIMWQFAEYSGIALELVPYGRDGHLNAALTLCVKGTKGQDQVLLINREGNINGKIRYHCGVWATEWFTWFQGFKFVLNAMDAFSDNNINAAVTAATTTAIRKRAIGSDFVVETTLINAAGVSYKLP